MDKELAIYNNWVENLKTNVAFAAELSSIKDDENEIKDRFYKALNFGTAGLRGLMSLGTNRMNIFTIGHTTQGLANYLKKSIANPKVTVCYDSRNMSKEFAQHTASILAANGCQVHLFPHIAPTPVLAYTAKELGCDCGIMITASHNPKEYNGYKVFDGAGCQIDTKVAGMVTNEISKVDMFSEVKTENFHSAIEQGNIQYVTSGIEEKFIIRILQETLRKDIAKTAGLKIVYTPLNGTGNIFVRDALKRMGVEHLEIVKEQEHPDGNFPTCPYPNPEFKEALELGLRDAIKADADILMATDPDADRLAIAVKYEGDYHILSGNHLGVLLLDYIGTTRLELGIMPKNPIAIRSIVTTKLTDKVANEYGVQVRDVLTGFRFAGEVIAELEQKGEENRVILTYEEACGFLIGTHIKDKDAVVASALVTEMASYYKSKNINLMEKLDEIYKKHGYYSNMAQNLAFEGEDGMLNMTDIMSSLRKTPPAKIVGRKVVGILDYEAGTKLENGIESKLLTEPSNVLEYLLEDGCGIIIRPSGTEPKLKLYYSLIGKSAKDRDILEQEYKKASIELAGIEA